ncbi:MAG: serine hydrolase [Alicyclobacillus sp.]|nr:serine hydrolase [Alicyclobacillus sp.]
MLRVPTATALSGFTAFARQVLADWNVAGAAVAVVQGDQVVYAEGFGYRDVEAQREVTPETVFAIGSASKAFTSLSVALMVDEGKLDWDAPVRRYLPGFELKDPVASQYLSLRDMLTHRSGLPRHDLMWYNSSCSREELIDRMRHLEPSKDFRTTWQYQNHMYMASGYVAGRANGSSWEELVRERIFRPLGMDHSSFTVEEMVASPNYALPYEGTDGALHRMPFRDISAIGPAGSINSNVLDMANWLTLHLNGGLYGGERVVSERSLAELHKPQMVCQLYPWKFAEMPVMTYGMGWFVEPYRGHQRLHHGGNIDGFTALVTLLPDEKTGIVVLTNMNGTLLPMVLTNNLCDRLLGLNELDWNERLQREYDKMKSSVAEAKQKLRENRREGTTPSHALEDYVGVYEHPGYGTFAVTLSDDGALQATYNNLTMPLIHYHYDYFELYIKLAQMSLLTSFQSDAMGQVRSVSVPLEPSIAPKEIVFTRQAK